MKSKIKVFLCVLFAAFLVACGGGGSGGDSPITPPPPPPPPPPESTEVAPAPRVDASIQIPGFGAEDYARLSDNRGRAWVRPLPLDTDVVFRLPQPLSHLLFQWMSSSNYGYDVTQFGAPVSYRIQVSSNSTNGADGAWTTVANVSNNQWAARAHEIRGENLQWIRFRITGGGSTIDEFDIHDLNLCQSGAACDTWGFIGDSITADTFWRPSQAGQAFNELVNACSPTRFPSMMNFGIGGNNSGHVLARLQQTINNNPGIHFWAVGIGTNDGEAGPFEQNLRGIINTLLTNGKQPVLARVPYSSSLPDSRIQSLNEVIDRLRGEYNLPAGPDLYTHFRNNPSHLRDGIHPTDNGVAAIQGLWAQAACNLSLGGGGGGDGGGDGGDGGNGGGASCSERALLEHFGKNRLMVGAMAGDAFFQQNPNLMDVRYLYLADRIFSSETPCTSCSPECREAWWGCWEQPAGRYLMRFLETAESGGQIPMITYYTFAQTSGNEAQVSPANELSFSRRYFNDWRFMLQQIGQRSVLLHIEPDLWGYAQHRNRESPLNLPAVVRAANPTDCGSFDDNFAGFSRCLISMVRKYAPNAKVGLHASAWATGEFDLNINTDPNRNIRNHAVEVGNYLRRLGAAEADFLVLEALDRDADYYRIHRGENRWWNQNQTLPNFSQHFQWASELRSVVGKPLVWWQIPVGHENSLNVPVTNPNQQNPQQGYRDNRVDYFLTHMDDVVSLGGVLVAFGAGAGDQTNPLTDGGNLARRTTSYKQSSAGFGFCDVTP